MHAPILASFLGSFTGLYHLLTQIDSDQVKLLASQHVWLALAVCFASGILTSLTPCVYPMIPITINIFGRVSQKKRDAGEVVANFNRKTFFLSAVYVAGMSVTYSVMGLVAGLTGSLFGKVLQSSFMLGFLTLLFLALALGQMGLFKIALPASWQTKLSQIGDTESLTGIFVMGLFSGLIVSPCVGPVIAGILAFVFDSSNALRGLVYFFSFSLGLGVLFLLIGGFSGLIARLPRSGAWMTRVNRVLGSLMLIAAGYYGVVWMKQMGVIASHAAPPVTSTQGIQWYTNEDDAFRAAKQKNLPMLVDFTAVWCEACHVLEQKVFTDPNVIAVSKDYVNLRIDVSDQNEANEAKLKQFGVLSLPTLVFVSRDGKVLDAPRVHGVVSADAFSKLLQSERNAHS